MMLLAAKPSFVFFPFPLSLDTLMVSFIPSGSAGAIGISMVWVGLVGCCFMIGDCKVGIILVPSVGARLVALFSITLSVGVFSLAETRCLSVEGGCGALWMMFEDEVPDVVIILMYSL